MTISIKGMGIMKRKIIYADPPWEYKDRAVAGKRGASFKYDVLSMAKLREMHWAIDQISDKDCALFMWTTYPMMDEAIGLIKTWGFNYKTVAFTWIKKTVKGKDHFGMGHWTRANPEIVLLGIRGKPKVINHGVRNIVYSQVREHSRKPDEIRDLIVQLLGDLPRIELFARGRHKGWKSWGNEVSKH